MGIYDRDYMKHRPEESRGHAQAPDGRLEGWAARFLRRHPRLPAAALIALGGLIVLVLVVSRVFGR